ncbi:MAG: FAD-dependent oxidoreductase, partial [Planctomycetaceae bacterium]|nr:FAD-dependent oxidoreductase [Planctomycetaceae bacterium]
MAESLGGECDVVVIGGGPGGYPAAFEAADHGKSVILVDEDPRLGGVCANRGCIPSKALLHVAKLLHEAKEAENWGVSFGKPKVNLDKLRDYKNGVVEQLTGGIGQLASARKVKRVQARASFLDSNTLELTQNGQPVGQVSFQNAIIATGSSPVWPPMFRIDDDRVMDSTGALELKDVPKKFLIIGGGIIGLELGQVYATLGSQVTVVEMLPNIATGADRDLIKPLEKRLKEDFEAIHVNTKVNSLKATRGGIVAEIEGEGVASPQTFDRVL